MTVIDTRVAKHGIENLTDKLGGTLKSPIEIDEYPPESFELFPKTKSLALKAVEQTRPEAENPPSSERLNTGLLSYISHEMRAPLYSIKGFTTALLQPDVRWDKKTRQDFLKTIDQETDRLTRLVSDLLDMSRLEAGVLKLDKDIYHLAEILESISGRLAKITQDHQLEVIVPKRLPPVLVDGLRIEQVLTNLVENATKYSENGTEITIEAKTIGDWVMVSVSDRGEGIPAEALKKVFDRFYRVESANGQKKGTGLGLFICRGIIEAHGGKIWVESKPGKGSKFSFSLRVCKEE